MKIIDLTTKSFNEALKGVKQYEQLYPALFSHYFKYWANKKRFSKNIINKDELLLKQKLISRNLKIIKKKILPFFDTTKISMILFVGQNTSTGHAFQQDDKIIVWIPIESYQTDLQVQIFVTHEIIHAIHYNTNPSFLFNSVQEQTNLGRQLITEGLATHFTAKIQNVSAEIALWADYLDEQEVNQWYKECQQKEKQIKKYCLENFFKSPDNNNLFLANDQKNIFKYRAGYYIGIQFINWLIKKQKEEQKILKIKRIDLEKLAIDYLKR